MLADRVGIIDHGRIVAEGTPAALKAEIGRPSVEAVPADPADRDRLAGGARALRRRRRLSAAHAEAVAVRLAGGDGNLADVVRALDSEGIAVEHLQLHAPTLDDVFLAKTGRSLEGAGEDDAEEPTSQAPGRRRERRARPPGRRAGAPVDRAHPAPAGADRALAASSRCSCWRSTPAGLDAATEIPGFPADSYLTFALAVPFIQARPVRRDQRRHRPRARHRDGLPRPPGADADERRRR